MRQSKQRQHHRHRFSRDRLVRLRPGDILHLHCASNQDWGQADQLIHDLRDAGIKAKVIITCGNDRLRVIRAKNVPKEIA